VVAIAGVSPVMVSFRPLAAVLERDNYFACLYRIV